MLEHARYSTLTIHTVGSCDKSRATTRGWLGSHCDIESVFSSNGWVAATDIESGLNANEWSIAPVIRSTLVFSLVSLEGRKT
jgi:hypothetical protein